MPYLVKKIYKYLKNLQDRNQDYLKSFFTCDYCVVIRHISAIKESSAESHLTVQRPADENL